MATRRANSSIVEWVQRWMETQLLQGVWAAGMRLPPERALAEEMGVSRSSIREATSRLAARGMLESRRGAGVYVTDQLQTGFASPWRQLVADHPELRWDTLEFRRELEGATAYYAAQRATAADIKAIDLVMKRLLGAYEAGDKAEEARADADFHEMISVASHNSMFRHLHAGVIRMLREHIALNLTGMQDDISGATATSLMHQHVAIWEAIRKHQPDAARDAMRSHIDFTWQELKLREKRR